MNKLKSSEYVQDDSTTGTSDFDDKYNDSEDCFCEGMLNDLMNGVNPQSKKRFFHISRDSFYDESNLIPDDMLFKTFTPRVPGFASKNVDAEGFAVSADGKYKEDGVTARICVSPSIEGCLNSLRLYLGNSATNPALVKHKFGRGVWYVYTPLQDISNYRIKSNAEIVKNNLVWDAKYTKETWILDKASMVLYGIIKVDAVSDPEDNKSTGKGNFHENMQGRFNFRWHWVKSNKDLMSDKNIADKINKGKNDQSKDNQYYPEIPKTGKRKEDVVIAKKTKEHNSKELKHWLRVSKTNHALMNADTDKISSKEFEKLMNDSLSARTDYFRAKGEDPSENIGPLKEDCLKTLAEIKAREAKTDKSVKEGCEYMPLSEFDHFFQEAKMKAKTRKELDDSDFALVYKDASGNKVRKYPINDEAHVKAAARMFPRGVPNKYRKEVAGKILRRAHKFGIDTEGWKSLNNAVKD